MNRILVALLASLLLVSAAACSRPAPTVAASATQESMAAPSPEPTPATTPSPEPGKSLGGDEGQISKLSKKIENKPSTDFALEDQYGKKWTLSDLKGKIVLLNFWATWCPPCVGEMPEFQKLYDRFSADGHVVVISVASTALEQQSAQMTRGLVFDFINTQKYTYPILFDMDGTVWAAYQQEGIPANYIIDTKGNIRLLIVGAFKDEAALYSALEAVRRADSGK